VLLIVVGVAAYLSRPEPSVGAADVAALESAAPVSSIVVAGQGKGAFFRLSSLEPGDTMTLAGPDGTDGAFEVVARESYSKTRIPLDRYFARDGAPRLTLITCGGPFDTKTRHYRDNVVVTAKPVS
jgi:hypothetical protein